MTPTEAALLVIAVCQLAWLVGAIVVAVRMRALARRIEPLVEQVKHVAEHANRIAEHLEEMARTARQVENRVAGTASRVLDQIEPPIRTLAATLAGVRAGVGKLFEKPSGNHHEAMVSTRRG